MNAPRPPRLFLLLLLAALGLSSCLSSPDAWSFCCTRAVYGAPLDPRPDSDFAVSGGGEGAWIVPVLLLLPLAIDLVILPVTLVHDLALS